MIKYNEIREHLKTGDLVFFSGRGVVSYLIKKFTRCKWSHLGMVLKLDEFDFVALWESTTLSNINDINGQQRKGVQIVQLSERIGKYEGEVSVRRLSSPLPHSANLRLSKLRTKLKGRDYERSEAEIIKSCFDFAGLDNDHDLSSVFCSELVAEAYKDIGLINDKMPSNEYTPADFSRMNGLYGGYSLGPHEIIVNN